MMQYRRAHSMKAPADMLNSGLQERNTQLDIMVNFSASVRQMAKKVCEVNEQAGLVLLRAVWLQISFFFFVPNIECKRTHLV